MLQAKLSKEQGRDAECDTIRWKERKTKPDINRKVWQDCSIHKSKPRSPLPATATKHLVETGIEIQGSFASEIHEKGKVIGWRSDDNQTQSGDNQRRNNRNKNRTRRSENFKSALERGSTRQENDTAQQHQHKDNQAHHIMLNGRQYSVSETTDGIIHRMIRTTRRRMVAVGQRLQGRKDQSTINLREINRKRHQPR